MANDSQQDNLPTGFAGAVFEMIDILRGLPVRQVFERHRYALQCEVLEEVARVAWQDAAELKKTAVKKCQVPLQKTRRSFQTPIIAPPSSF